MSYMDNKLTIHSTEGFCHEFVSTIRHAGFGAMTKGEMDLFVLHLLHKHADISTCSLQELSLLLRVPVSRLSNQLYAMRLRYPPESPEGYLRKQFSLLLKRTRLKIDGQYTLTLPVEDRYLREGLSAQLKLLGHYSDGTFNRELLKLSLDAFADLANELLEAEVADQLVNAVQQEDKKKGIDESLDQYTVGNIFRRLVRGVATDTTDKLVELGKDYLSDMSVDGICKLLPIVTKVALAVNLVS